MSRRIHAMAAFAVAILATSASCGPSRESIDWTIPINAGTLVYTLPIPDRTDGTIGVERVLEFGGEAEAAPASRFYYALDLSVDSNGDIYVYDSGNHRIQVFDASGQFVRSIGDGEGQGPAEFGRAGRIAVADTLVAYVRTNGVMSTWDLEGNHVWSGYFAATNLLKSLEGSPDGNLVGSYAARASSLSEGSTRLRAVGRISPTGDELLQFAALPDPRPVSVERMSGTVSERIFTKTPRGEPDFAVGPVGSNVYVAATAEYQILALTMEGRQRWALRVAGTRIPIPDDWKEAELERIRKDTPDVMASEFEWPTTFPALSIAGKSLNNYGHGRPVRVDGHERVFVFPYVPGGPKPGELRSVDIFSSDGELLFSGHMPSISWMAARGDFVYGLELSNENEQQVVVYRLSIPGGSSAGFYHRAYVIRSGSRIRNPVTSS